MVNNKGYIMIILSIFKRYKLNYKNIYFFLEYDYEWGRIINETEQFTKSSTKTYKENLEIYEFLEKIGTLLNNIFYV